jgi:hypothetical protein
MHWIIPLLVPDHPLLAPDHPVTPTYQLLTLPILCITLLRTSDFDDLILYGNPV